MRRLVCAVIVFVVCPALVAAGPDTTKQVADPHAPPGPSVKADWPDGPGYEGSLCTYDWVDISATGTELLLSDDAASDQLDLGFPFELYDRVFNQVFISSNGFLSFQQGRADNSNYCPILSQFSPTYFVAPLWDDLDPGDLQTPIYYQSFDVCPRDTGRCFVAQWDDICRYPGGDDCIPGGTFEAIVFEDGRILFQFLDPGEYAGASSTTGIAGGNLIADHSLTYACNVQDSLTPDLCVQFLPVGGLFTFVAGGIAHAPGSQGTTWRSSLSVGNFTDRDTDLEFSFDDGQLKLAVDSTIAAGQIREWDDVTVSLFGIPGDTAGTVRLVADAGVTMTARTYNQSPAGTFGQYLPGLSAGGGLPPGVVGRLPNLKSNAGYRTNIGVVNISPVACPVRFQLYDADGVAVGGSRQIDVGPFGWSQVNRVFRNLGVHDIAYATVELVNGDCEAWVYASVVDEGTGDPTTIPVTW